MRIEADVDDLIREQWLRARKSGELIWKTNDGKEISVKDMTDQHLDNAIRCALRNAEREEIVVENSDILDF